MRDTKRAPDHSKDTPKALQKHWGTPRALQEPMDIHGTRTLKGHLSNWSLKLFGHMGTQALRHSDTLVLEALEPLYLADSIPIFSGQLVVI